MDNITTLPPLEFLRSFVVFAESPNIVEAARVLKISQPLLSKQLKAFEENVGAPLFEFAGRKKILTTLGHDMHTLVKSRLDHLGAELHQLLATQSQSRPLRIGGRKEILEQLVLHLHYEQSLAFFPLGSEEVEKQLAERNIDIGISQKTIDSARLIRKKLWADEFVLCWNAHIKGVSPMNMVEALTTLLGYRSYDYVEISVLTELLQSAKLRLKSPQTTFSDWRVLVNALKQEKSWSVLPARFVEGSTELRFMNLPVELRHESQFFVYYQKEFSKLPWFKALIEAIANCHP
jgi:DNA-binding transcriptional LysR family regulator